MFTNPASTQNSRNAADERLHMVNGQLRSRGIRDERVLAAMGKVPREEFANLQSAAQVYGDHPLPIGSGQTVSQPYIVAAMVEALDIEPSDRVLEIGTGTGYEAAVLAELAAEVWTVERIPELAARAGEIISRLGYHNVHVVEADGSQGLPEQAPFQKILVAAAAPDVPRSLFEQLEEKGRLVIPIGTRDEQQLQLIRKVNGQIVATARELCRFVPLIGQEGWKG
jgi:protein-L-isoaspartate(D-aspartate) O-methyltransferase